MGLYRDETGLVFEADDTYARSQGFDPVAPEERAALNEVEAERARGEERGALGTINAAATGLASAATLGGSDYLLSKFLSPHERERVLAEIEAHPYARGAAEAVGAVATGLALPGSSLARTPAGYLGSLAAREAEAGIVQGGLRGTAKALGAMGTEGALQSGGNYIGMSALADKETTVEGLAGALGTGFGFGAAGGGVALGISKGSMAARKMFSRAMDGEKGAQVAESAWTTAQQEMLDANAKNAELARQRLDDLRAAKAEALKYRQEAKTTVREEQIRREAAGPTAKYEPEEPIQMNQDPLATDIDPATGGMPTSVFKRPEELGPSDAFDPAAARQFDDVFDHSAGPQPLADDFSQPGGPVTSVFSAPKTDILKTATLEAKIAEDLVAGKPAPDMSSLEQQLAGTKAALDRGEKFVDLGGEKAVPGSAVSPQIPPGKKPPPYEGRNPSRSVEDFIAEKASRDAGSPPAALTERDARVRAILERSRGEVPKANRDLLSKAPYEPTYPDFGEQLKPTKKQRFGNLRTHLGQELEVGPLSGRKSDGMHGPKMRERLSKGESLADMREQHTRDLLGGQIAGDERALIEAIDEFEDASRGLNTEQMSQFAEMRKEWRGVEPTGGGRKHAIAMLDQAHDEALARIHAGGSAKARGDAMNDAAELERMLENLRAPQVNEPLGAGQFMDEIHPHVDKLTRYEKASAKLSEALGEAADPRTIAHAQALAEAESANLRKVTERTARAVDDAEQFGPWEFNGPKHKSPKERVVYAKERQLEADNAYDAIATKHGDAAREYGAAQKKVGEDARAKKSALKEDAKAQRARDAQAARAGKATGLGGMLEIMDIPGLPKPSDLPVVGPLLGAYLKFKALKMAMGRTGLRVPATADNRVAALASRTRDRVARAVDRSLGLMSKAGSVATKVAPPLAGILSSRIYDDGRPDAKKGAPITEQAAVRMRELNAYVNDPGAIENDVRRELRGVTDPDLIAAAETHRRAMFQYMARNMPPMPDRGPLNKSEWLPSPAQAMSFARRWEAVSDPAGVYERLAQQQALLSLEAAEALREVYPQLFGQAQQRVLERSAELKQSLPHPMRVQLSLLYKMPLDASLEPANIKISQSVYVKPAPAPTMMGAPAVPPTPSVAQPTNLTAIYQTPEDRRAQR